MQIHDWMKHNAYHQTFSDRAKKAAAARWKGQEKKKKGQESTRQDKSKHDSSIALSMLVAFDEFWKAFPLKVGKGNAESAWKKHGCHKLLPQILVAVRACKVSAAWTKEGGQFIPHPTTWLNRRGWEDELLPATNGTGIREKIIPNILRDEDP